MRSAISASIMCANPLAMREDLEQLQTSGADYYHCDIMDGHFVPNLMLSTETVRAVKQMSRLPLDLHLMVDHPAECLPWLAFGEGDLVAVHAEADRHLQRTLRLIANRGATAAVAINPATPLCFVEQVLPDIGMLLVMTVNPGFAGQKLVPQTLAKITEARNLLDSRGYSDIPIEVDGNCSFENIPKMEQAGASIFVVGSSSVFDPALGIERGIAKVRELFRNR
ncbi:MAG TPA: ribulose-phosphate 3-epimerase [Candidatus Limiplasma sp.]|mgnify:CR=1 FL=1|nr:ribulose-phosphate 3-epimerase [Candidatus Limiplasma sp.]HPS82378.1 ribulose-phosphate 3-epimerase [Candidatus Limiplasma sp.]